MKRPPHWPTPDQRLLLRAALLDGTRAEEAWTAVLPRLDLDLLDDGSQRLLPLLERNLSKLGIDNPHRDRMRGVHRFWWSRNQLLFHRGGEVLRALNDRKIPTVVLKGAAIAPRYYGDLGLRPMSDFDVLVPRDRVVETIGILERRGWTSAHKVHAGFRAIRHGVSFFDEGGRTIDLHWAMYAEDCLPDSDVGVWATTEPVEVAGARTSTLPPSSQLINACGHGTKFATVSGIRWMVDATLIVRAGGIDWDAMVSEAVRRHFSVRMRLTLGYVAAALDAPVPQNVLERLAAQPVSRMERLEYQVRSRDHRLLGGLPGYWFNYLRSEDARGRRLPLGFPRYLQHAWGLPSVRELPAAAGLRLRRRLSGFVQGDHV